jgi:Zn-dependent protease
VNRLEFPFVRVLGIPVRVHLSFLVFAAFVLLAADGWSRPEVVTRSLTYLVVLFAALLAHELGHGVSARAVGGSASRIVLWGLGGWAEVSHPRRLRPRIVVALAGVGVNLLLAALAAAVLAFRGGVPGWPSVVPGADVVAMVYGINLALAILNLLPAFPYDGGEVAEALLGRRFGPAKAAGTVLATGVVAGLFFLLCGIAYHNELLVAVGFSGLAACGARYHQLRAGEDEHVVDEFESFSPERGWRDEAPEEPRRVPAPPKPSRRRDPESSPAGPRVAEPPLPILDERRVARDRLDGLLDRIARDGIGSLSSEDRRFLDEESRRLRARNER